MYDTSLLDRARGTGDAGSAGRVGNSGSSGLSGAGSSTAGGAASGPSATGGDASAGEDGAIDPCVDSSQNGAETAVDCGGGTCPACPIGKSCAVDSDCEGQLCVGEVCTTIDCSDRQLNGRETDIDCGGADCPPCAAGESCSVHRDCATSFCVSRRCAFERTCAEIKRVAPESTSGIYPVDPDGDGVDVIDVYCDMVTLGGGWTRVGFESAGAGGEGIAGALWLLGATSGEAEHIASGSGNGIIGQLFNGAYTEVRLTWDTEYIQFTPARPVFLDNIDNAMPVAAVSTSNTDLSDWINAAGSAVFCRAGTSTNHPGDSSWAIKPAASMEVTCGCNGDSWTGQGAFYGGAVPANATCSEWGGGWAGVRANGEPKGAVTSTADLSIWVR